MGGFKKIGTGNVSAPTSTEQMNVSTGGFKRIEGWTGAKPATPAAPAAPATPKVDISVLRKNLDDAKKAEEVALKNVNDYVSFHVGNLDMQDPAELQGLKDAATEATKKREQLEKDYYAHEDSVEDQFEGFGKAGRAVSTIIAKPFLAVDVATQTANHAAKGEEMDMDSLAMQKFGRLNEVQGSVTEGMSDTGKFLTNTAMSIGQNLYSLPLNVIMPGMSAVSMGVTSAADKMHELGTQGESATRALVRGGISGGIEAATEAIPLGTLADLIKTGGKGVVKNLLKQGGVEAAEEGISYTANYIADKLAKDPNAKWDWGEFWTSVGSGGLSGLFFGAGGTVVGNIKNGQTGTQGGTDQKSAAGVNLPGAGTNGAEVGVDTAEENILPAGENGQKNTASMGEAVRYTPVEITQIRREGETFRNLVAGVDATVSEFFRKWRNGRKSHLGEKLEKLYLAKMPDSVKRRVSDILGYEVSDRDFIVTNDEVKHIVDHHGSAEQEIQKGNLPLDDWVFDSIQDVLTQPDTISKGHAGTGTSSNKTGVIFEKTMPNGRVVCVQFDNPGRGTMSLKTLYVKESTSPAVNTPGGANTFTSKTTEPVLSSNITVSQAEQGVKGQSAQTGVGLSTGKRDLLSAWELDRPVASKRDLLADWELQGTPAAQATEAETVGEEYWHSIMDEGAVPASETDTPGYFDALLEWVDRQRVPAEPKKASVATRPAPAKKSLSQKADEAWSFFKRKMVDAGDTVTKIGKDIGDRYLYAYYNFARASSNAAEQMIARGGAQTNVYGERVGQSLADIWEPIRAEGDEYYRRFEEYLLHRHNIDRMSRYDAAAVAQAELNRQIFIETYPWIALETEQRLRSMAELGPFQLEAQSYLTLIQEVNRLENTRNKPVFGWEVDADASRAEVARIEREHPEFKGMAEQVYRFNRNLMQYRVDSGQMTREQADKLEKIYPHYVPTYRQTEGGVKTRRKKNVQVSKTVGRAEGGNADLMPLHLAMARQTMQVTREGAKNRFGARLLEDVLDNEAALKDYVRSAEEYEWEPHPDTFDALDDPTPQKTNTFTVFRDGRAWVMEVDEGLYEAVSALSPEGKEANVLTKTIRSANDLFKKLVTGYNPMFMARNVVRDLQDAGLYSKDLSAWAQNYPLAVKEIATDGEYWRKYKALGGTYSSVFDYEQGYQTDESRSFLSRNVLDRIEALNMATEQAPRLAEFMATVKKGDGSMDNLMEAMYNAADVTVNFGRAGTKGQEWNQNFVPFLNPGIQGFDKMVRRFTETKGAKEWSKLIVKCAALGIAPTIINAFLYKDDEEWEDLKDSDKDVNYLIKLGDGKWLKIPKGRTLSLMGMAADRAGDALRGEEVDLVGVLKTTANQIAPANPLTNNILTPLIETAPWNYSNPGRTWYGSDIESQRLRNYAPGQRYDESTDVFSKWLGGVLNLSPKKINYLLDQYSGVVGDFVLPLLTPQAEQNPFAKSFVLDSVTSNKINGEFYDKSDEITFAKNGGDGAMALVNRFWNKQAGAVSDIYAEIREIENDTRLTDAEKKERVREARAILNGVQKNALEVLPEYEAAVRKYYTGSSSEELDLAYRKANCEVFGAEYALKVYDKSVYEKAASLEKKGIDYSAFYDAYFAQRDVTGDPDGKGGTVYLSASRNKKKAIDEATPWLNPWSRQILYEAFGVSEKVW